MSINTYTDIDFNFVKSNVQGVSTKTNTDAIEQSIMNILMTSKGEKLFNPLFGSNIKKYLFDKLSLESAIEIETEIEFALTNFEPRIKINEIIVDLNYTNDAYDVSINYTTVSLKEDITFEFALELI